MEGGMGWRRTGRRGCDNVGRWGGGTVGNSTVRSLWRLGGQGEQMENGPTKEQIAGPPPLPAQLPQPEEELAALARHGQHGAHAVGDIPATNTTARRGQKAWCLGTEEVLPKNISNYLRSSRSQ